MLSLAAGQTSAGGVATGSWQIAGHCKTQLHTAPAGQSSWVHRRKRRRRKKRISGEEKNTLSWLPSTSGGGL